MMLLCSSNMDGILACHWKVLVFSFISLVVNWQKSERKTSRWAAEFSSAAISAITTVSIWVTWTGEGEEEGGGPSQN